MYVEEGSLLYRIVLIGASNVGKTCLVNRFIHNKFNSHELNTIGAMYETYSQIINNIHVELQLWDTAGQEKYRSLCPVYYKDAAGAIIVFDITTRKTFDELDEWLESFRSVTGDEATVVIVGNKSDLAEEAAVTEIEAKEWADSKGFQFFSTSAKNGTGIKEMFDFLITTLMSRKNEFAMRGFQKYIHPEIIEQPKKNDCNC